MPRPVIRKEAEAAVDYSRSQTDPTRTRRRRSELPRHTEDVHTMSGLRSSSRKGDVNKSKPSPHKSIFAMLVLLSLLYWLTPSQSDPRRAQICRPTVDTVGFGRCPIPSDIVLDWAAARYTLVNTVSKINTLVVLTSVFEKYVPGGPEIHTLTTEYLEIQDQLEDEIDEPLYGHTSFISRVSFDIKFLSDNLRYMLDDHGFGTYFLVNFWYSRQNSPLGRLERDFVKVVDKQAKELTTLIANATRLVENLDRAKAARTSLIDRLIESWVAWDTNCMGNTKGVLGSGFGMQYNVVVGQHPDCGRYKPIAVQRAFKELGDALDEVPCAEGIQGYVTKQLGWYKSFQDSWLNLAERLKNGKEREAMTLRSYQKVFENLQQEISRLGSDRSRSEHSRV